MDKLFKNKKKICDDFKFDEKTAAVFDNMLKRSVPFYTECQRMIIELAQKYAKNRSCIYDLGCSTGTTLAGLTKSIGDKDIKFIGVDSSAAMLKRAEQKLNQSGTSGKCQLINADLHGNFEIRNASVVIMNLTLQFIRPPCRDAVISRIYKGLKKGGCFILVEKILSRDPALNRTFIKLYYDYKIRQHYSQLEISRKREALENVLIPYRYDENQKLLGKNGFKYLDEFFRWYNFSGIIAIKN